MLQVEKVRKVNMNSQNRRTYTVDFKGRMVSLYESGKSPSANRKI